MTHHRHKHSDDNAAADETPLRGDATTHAPPPGAPAGQPTDQPIAAPAAPATAANVQALQAERDDLLARLQRLSADYVNYQRRAAREMADACEFANAKLLRDLLPVLDDLELAIAAAEKGGPAQDPVLSGMRLLHTKALDVLGGYGLKPIQAQGQAFDPARHHAIMQEASGEHTSPVVLRELQRGYELKGRVIRPAGVAVSRYEPEKPEAKEGGTV